MWIGLQAMLTTPFNVHVSKNEKTMLERFSYRLLSLVAANCLLRAHPVERNKVAENSNSDIVALSKKVLQVGNVGIDGKNGLWIGCLLGGLVVAAVDFGVATTLVFDGLCVVLVGGVLRGSGGDSHESEEDNLGEHLESNSTSWYWRKDKTEKNCSMKMSTKVVVVVFVVVIDEEADDGMFMFR